MFSADPTFDLLMRRPGLESLPSLPALPDGYSWGVMGHEQEAGVAQVLRLSFGDGTWTPERVHREVAASEDVLKPFVIEHGAQVIATTIVRELPHKYLGSGYLHYVAVHPDHQGQRLGRAVCLAVLHEFRALGCRDAVLDTDDFRLPSIKTYHNLGFVPEHRHASHPERWRQVFAELAQHQAPLSEPGA